MKILYLKAFLFVFCIFFIRKVDFMEFIYPFFITFTLVFFSELGDKTQLLVLSFSTKNKARNILLGVALGTFFSHGFAILFGSKVACFSNDTFQFYLKIFTYATFLLFGFVGFLPKKIDETKVSGKFNFLQRFSCLNLNPVLMVAFCILIGELGDKTFLASLSLGFQYPFSKFPLILGSVCGMVFCNCFAIFFGKFLGKHLKQNIIEAFSNLIFIVFGLLGFASLLWF